VVFAFASINVLYYIYRFTYVKPALHSWDEANLVMVYDLSDVFLDCFCHYFIEDFCINVHYGDYPIVLLFGGVFGFGMRVILASLNESGSVPSLSIS
jgi:hypothetical protein